MNTQITGYRISYFVFSFFVSCFIVFSFHKGFKPIDIITIPVFAILLFLVIDYSAQFVFHKNLEKFVVENFIYHKNINPSENDILESLTNQSEEIQNTPLFKKFAAYEQSSEEETIPKPHLPEEEHFPKPHLPEEEHIIPHMPEEEHFPKPHLPEEEHIIPHMPQEEHLPQEEHMKPSPTPSADKKAQQATAKQSSRPNINRHHMNDGKGLTNRNLDTINPININVSYNNNRPLTVNDFNDPNTNLSAQLGMGRRNNDLNRFRFDDGCQKKNTVSTETDANGTLLSPVNQTTVNTALADMNQRYYPAYLENPLNKNQPGVDVDSVFDEQQYKNQLINQQKYNQRANRNILQRKPHWTQSNYETTMMKRILNEKNEPSPVLLERPWSEWKPTEN